MWPWSTQACVPTKPKKSLICFQSPPPSNKCLQGIPNAWSITETSLLPPKPSKPSSAPPSSLLNATLHRKKTECEEYKETRMEGEDEEIEVGNKDGGQVVREMINSSTVLKACIQNALWMLAIYTFKALLSNSSAPHRLYLHLFMEGAQEKMGVTAGGPRFIQGFCSLS